MVCSRCKKRMAVVFMSRMEGNETINEGLCLQCAKELGIPQVQQMMDSMGISDDDLQMMSDQMMALTDEGDSFEMGGADTMPNFLQNLFGGNAADGAQAAPEGETATGDKKEKRTSKKKEPDKKRKFLANYCTNLTERARSGKLDRIIGREREIARVVQILSRRTKNNPCLIGEPGVGKTAIAEGIAQKIASGDVAFRLLDKELYLLDMTALVAGTQFRGQFESRVKGLIDEVKDAGNIILFIDEIHTIVGTGDSEGSMSAANILKPALSRGEIQVIGATTFNEYRKNIEKDSALERRFQPVIIKEPSIEDTYQVLLGVKGYYENFHHVKVPDPIVHQAVTLSERYINDRFLPDKAIDLLDEACACASLRTPELTQFEQLSRQHTDLAKQEEEMESNPGQVDYEKLAQVKSKSLAIREQLNQLEPVVSNVQVTLEDLAKVIELCTGISAAKIQESEFKKIGSLEEVLRSKIIGQDEAVSLVCAAIRRNRAGISKRRRPASFIFVGPTGVGKTELVKVLASELFDDVDPLIRLDMSEYMEKHAVSRMIGAPPGYVGYDEAGQLTEKVRRKPYSVVLFDEIEKAHPDVMNILLQILDEGRITDGQGRTVNFENTVIVMTSNAGSNDKSGIVGFNKGQQEIAKEKALKALSDILRPEFLGRVDEIVVFNPLEKASLLKIAGLMLDEIKEPLKEKGIGFGYDEKAAAWLVESLGSNKFGARDLRTKIRKEVEDRIAGILVDQFDNPPSMIALTERDGTLIFDTVS
ncbi:MAG: AAA family ATPase [Oscillospiraceae bacterium]|jgi:ATP-dependent Clp protease ATP-binding subunit ClpC